MWTPKHLVFDLDETLYPTSNGLMDAIRERIIEYIKSYMNLSQAEAEAKRLTYLHRYGLTLAGLDKEDSIDVEEYLQFVHDLPIEEYITPNPALDAMLARLPQNKVIFTNSERTHVSRVLKALHVSESRFSSVFDFISMNRHPKPDRRAYALLLEHMNATGPECLLIEDAVRNIIPASEEFGMKTVLIGATSPHADWTIDNILDLESIVLPLTQGTTGGIIQR